MEILVNQLVNQLQRRLDDISWNMCEGPMTTAETTAALHKMQIISDHNHHNLQDWTVYSQIILPTFLATSTRPHKRPKSKQAILRLLYKKDGKKRLKNWRPISPLNVDCKIAATVLANRLRPVLPRIIHEIRRLAFPTDRSSKIYSD